jgi:hypothetical protein
MELRRAGENPLLETRGEAHEKVDKNTRYSQITECLLEARKSHLKGLSAKEIAVMMAQKGYIPTSERNFASPRLTEMMEDGVVEPIGKIVCNYTGRKVAVYALVDGKWEV